MIDNAIYDGSYRASPDSNTWVTNESLYIGESSGLDCYLEWVVSKEDGLLLAILTTIITKFIVVIQRGKLKRLLAVDG